MEFKFTQENLEEINKILTRYPTKQSALMPVLYLAQKQKGWISIEVMQEVSSVLEISVEEVLGVVSFYTMFHKKPVGKYHLQVCTNVSCLLRKGNEIFSFIKEKLNIENGGITTDGKFSLEEVECMGSCGTAPMIAVNEDYFENLSKEKTLEIINSFN